MKKIINNPHLTAIKRNSISFPTRWLQQHGLLRSEILDFGCGYGFDTLCLTEQGYDIKGYDNYYRPDYPERKFDTIICNYVLNVLEPDKQVEVLMSVSELLKPTGKAYFSVRRDVENEGFRTHYIYKLPTYQCNVVLPYKSVFSNFKLEIYEYQHYNKIEPRNIDCPLCNPTNTEKLVTEIASSVAFMSSFPVNVGHALIVPKRHISDYFDLTLREQRSLWLVVNRCKEIIQEQFNPDGFKIGVNIGDSAGQSFPHVHIDLIPYYTVDCEISR